MTEEQKQYIEQRIESIDVNDWEAFFNDSRKMLGGCLGVGGVLYEANIEFLSDITEIPSGCFSDSKIYKIAIPANITYIGFGAFEGCTELQDVTFSEGLSYIGTNAFRHCAKLEKVELPGTLTEIGTAAFDRCVNLKEVTLPQSLKFIGDSAFVGCTNLRKVNFQGTVADYLSLPFGDIASNPTALGADLYIDGKLLTDLVVSNGSTHVRSYSFFNNNNLTSVSCSNTVVLLGGAAFANCKKLKSVKLNEGLVTIGAFCFKGCENLDNINIPKTVTRIEKECLSDCGNITITYGGTAQQWKELLNSKHAKQVFKNTKYVCTCVDGVVKKTK